MTVLIIGSPHDRTIVHTVRSARHQRVPHLFFDLVLFLRAGSYWWDVEGRCGRLGTGTLTVDLPDADITGIYVRPVDVIDSFGSGERPAAAARLRALTEILATVDALVVNRPGTDLSNWTKAYHLALLSRCGFTVPTSLLTNDADEARAFLRAVPDAVFKGASGEKTVASACGPEQLDELGLLPRSPVLFQERIRGADVRTHLVGREHFSERIDCEGVNYQYCPGAKTFTPARAPQDVVEHCRAYQAASGLAFIGFDFMVDEDDGYTVLEANPMPGYDGYDRRLGLSVSHALLDLLRGA
ncbi:RimK family alpha-L-glutamate ligase [Streptomyces sp. NPDC051555]|uniref:RimK family alpha-L-glutamate ligase n=1 Tax=Streptomyces sp. NPDC051555 TaxID=3365657 RepID=UPI0037A1102D